MRTYVQEMQQRKDNSYISYPWHVNGPDGNNHPAIFITHYLPNEYDIMRSW